MQILVSSIGSLLNGHGIDKCPKLFVRQCIFLIEYVMFHPNSFFMVNTGDAMNMFKVSLKLCQN